jgi:glycosyltransferase involved in cell wall biosynthesis
MAAGIPVIASGVGGLAEMVNGAGLLVERGSPRALADAMIELARDPNRANAVGRKGYSRHRRQFRLDRMIGRHERLYEQLRTSRTHSRAANVGQSS